MRTLILIMIGVFYLIHYEGYYWDPCSKGSCFAINGYEVEPETIVCGDMDCVEQTLNSRSIDHLKFVDKVWYQYSGDKLDNFKVKRLNIKHKVVAE